MSDPGGSRSELAGLLFQAHALIDRRRFAQARQVLAQGLADYPDNSQMQYLGAFVDYSEGRIADATQAVRGVLARDPHHFGARTLSGHLHEKAHEFAQAEATWIGLLREYPERPECFAAYSELMLRTLHIEKAWQLVQEGFRLSPDHEESLYVAALIEVIRGRSRAQDNVHLQRLLHEHPERLNTLQALVVALDQRGETASALRVAQQLLRTRPDSEQLAELAQHLKLRAHWSLLPLYPMQRWGWGGAAAVTAIGFIGIHIATTTLSESVAAGVSLVWLAYVLYSWVWPRILKKML